VKWENLTRQRIMTAGRLGLELEGQNALLNDGIIFPKKVEVNEFSEVWLRSSVRNHSYALFGHFAEKSGLAAWTTLTCQ
jgi:hypothetical protein